MHIVERRDGLTIWQDNVGKYRATPDSADGAPVEPYCCLSDSPQEAVELLYLAEHEGEDE